MLDDDRGNRTGRCLQCRSRDTPDTQHDDVVSHTSRPDSTGEPVNREGRPPQAEAGASVSMAADTNIVAHCTDDSADEQRRGVGRSSAVPQSLSDSAEWPQDGEPIDESALWRALGECPADRLSWAALGYRVGLVCGESAVLRRLGQAGDSVMEGDLAILRRPRHSETAVQRQVHHQPCPTRCASCSQCLHSLAYWARGGRDYLGIEAEPDLPDAGRSR